MHKTTFFSTSFVYYATIKEQYSFTVPLHIILLIFYLLHYLQDIELFYIENLPIPNMTVVLCNDI